MRDFHLRGLQHPGLPHENLNNFIKSNGSTAQKPSVSEGVDQELKVKRMTLLYVTCPGKLPAPILEKGKTSRMMRGWGFSG